jgi:hypothetical protein
MLKSYPEQNLLLVDCSNLEEDWVKCDFKDFMPSTLDITNCVVKFWADIAKDHGLPYIFLWSFSLQLH